jgi:hypothetical protein
MIRPGFAHGGVAVLVCLLLVACNQAVAPQASNTVRQQQIVDGVTIALEMAAQPELNRPQHFIITLSDAQGQFIDDAEVYLDLEMTEHPMGTNKPIASPQGAGIYDAEAVYTMNGPWTVAVVVERDGQTYRATFDAVVDDTN